MKIHVRCDSSKLNMNVILQSGPTSGVLSNFLPLDDTAVGLQIRSLSNLIFSAFCSSQCIEQVTDIAKLYLFESGIKAFGGSLQKERAPEGHMWTRRALLLHKKANC